MTLLADDRRPAAAGIALVGLNARYTHTCLAIRCLKNYLLAEWPSAPPVILLEWSINDPPAIILEALYGQGSRIFGFSCYIWNISLVRRISRQLKQVRPDAIIVWGGPEVSFNAADRLRRNPAVDLIIRGEGEVAFYLLVRNLCEPEGDRRLGCVPGLIWRGENGRIVENEAGNLLDPADWPFPYTEDDLVRLEDRIIYYETSRGCPHQCSYCLSSLDRSVRFRPLPQVFAELDRLLLADPLQVKLVDRTFNCDTARAIRIWQYLLEHRPAGSRTGFHFEVAGDALDAAAVELLSTAPDGYFQLEIGVQTIQPATLAAINRHFQPEKLAFAVQALRRAGRVRLHMDLIAGLPGETPEQFAASFNWVYRLQPQQLQLGFLKILPGSPIESEAASRGYVWQDDPPYEVLRSDAMAFLDLVCLKQIEHLLDLYYNNNLFQRSLAWLAGQWPDPYAFFADLSAWPGLADSRARPVHLAERARQLADFAVARVFTGEPPWRQDAWLGLLRADYLDSSQKDFPSWLGFWESTDRFREANRNGLLRKKLLQAYPQCRRVLLERFPFDWRHYKESGELRPGFWLAVYDTSGVRPAVLDIFPEDKLYCSIGRRMPPIE